MAQRGHKCPDFVGGPILPVWSLRSREPVPATKRQPTLDIFAGGDVASATKSNGRGVREHTLRVHGPGDKEGKRWVMQSGGGLGSG
jgi:hypothetical protein